MNRKQLEECMESKTPVCANRSPSWGGGTKVLIVRIERKDVFVQDVAKTGEPYKIPFRAILSTWREAEEKRKKNEVKRSELQRKAEETREEIQSECAVLNKLFSSLGLPLRARSDHYGRSIELKIGEDDDTESLRAALEALVSKKAIDSVESAR